MSAPVNAPGAAARAIRDMALRAAEHHARHQQYAEVTNASPLKAQLASGLALDDDDLVLGASVRSYDKGQGIKRGDTLVVVQMDNEDWLAVEVVTDVEMTAAGVPIGGTTGQVLQKKTASDYDTQWYTPSGTSPDATPSVKGVVQLAGDLAGTAAAPQIAAGVITDTEVNAANKDGAAGTASMRTLGTGATQAAAGNDSRFGAGGPPSGAASGDLSGTYPAPQIAAGVIVDADVNSGAAIAESKLNLATDAAVGTGSRRTLGAGAQQAMPGNRTLDAISAPVSAVTLGGNLLTNVGTPVSAQDAATKGYADSVAQGLDAKASVAAASTANVTLPTITGTQLDGVTLAATSGVGRRVLLKDQTTTSQNGIYYVVSQIAGTSFTLARALDMDTWSEVPGSYVWVEEGTVNADTGWVCTSDLLTGGVLRVIGTDAMVWTQFSGAGTITAGAGLTKTGNTLDVVGGTGLTVAADLVSLTVPVTVVNGGTGQTTAKAARETGMGAAGYYSSATHSAGTTISITQATHGLRASRGLIVQAQDEATGAVEWPDIVVAATGDVTVTYAASVAANAKRITVIG